MVDIAVWIEGLQTRCGLLARLTDGMFLSIFCSFVLGQLAA